MLDWVLTLLIPGVVCGVCVIFLKKVWVVVWVLELRLPFGMTFGFRDLVAVRWVMNKRFCHKCSAGLETVAHVVWECLIAGAVWKALQIS
ncbi:hypothetical protein EPI10_007262 [Gossypium australe]|uniref:Uncharacterized protein n=1 Tax=Gossypium australe TaxID=47621 RepID=A0A5B6WW25_9ROSI|nr:hypothetical protein EPI10_007262 [Gossypium australe]